MKMSLALLFLRADRISPVHYCAAALGWPPTSGSGPQMPPPVLLVLSRASRATLPIHTYIRMHACTCMHTTRLAKGSQFAAQVRAVVEFLRVPKSEPTEFKVIVEKAPASVQDEDLTALIGAFSQPIIFTTRNAYVSCIRQGTNVDRTFLPHLVETRLLSARLQASRTSSSHPCLGSRAKKKKNKNTCHDQHSSFIITPPSAETSLSNQTKDEEPCTWSTSNKR